MIDSQQAAMQGDQLSQALTSKELVLNAMMVVAGVVRGKFYKRYNVSSSPRSTPGGDIMVLTSRISGGIRGDEVGDLRVIVYVPNDSSLGSTIRVEWTRDGFGFWYRKDIVLNGEKELLYESQKKLREVLRFVEHTANGTVKISSMNRMFRTIKKNKITDRVMKQGLVIG